MRQSILNLGAAQGTRHSAALDNALKEAGEILLVRREAPVAGLTRRNNGEVRREGIVEENPRRDVIHRLRRAATVDAAPDRETLVKPVGM
jgi:hypothetical protein